MESAKAGSQSTQICFQEDIKIVLDGTKKLMELMELKKEEIAELEQDITKHENCFKNMRNNARNLKEIINKKFADIENRSNFTNIIEEYKTKFIPTAQTIYTIFSDFNKVVTSAETKLNEFIGIANKNEQIYNKEIQWYNQKEKQLTTELEETVKVHFQDTKSKEALAKENSALILEKEDLAHEVELYEKKIKDVIGFEENNNNLKQEIIMVNDQCNNYDDEILVVYKSFDSKHLQSQEESASISTNIVNYENKIRELVKNSQHLVDKLEGLVNKENNYDTELSELKDSIKKSEINLMTLSKESEALIKKTIEAQEMFDKEIISLTETLTKIEELIKCNQEINSRLSEKIEARKTEQIELLNSDITALKVMITELEESSKEDVGRQSEVKQDKLDELNLEVQNAKETYKLHLIEKQEILQAVIKDTESGNTKMAEYIRQMETELTEFRDKTIQLQKEKKSDEKVLQGLTKPVIPPLRRLRRWDSDSTIGEED